MSGKPVDLGPMSMPVGDEAADFPKVLVARQSDVQLLKQLLADGGQRRNGGSVPHADESEIFMQLPHEFTRAEADVLVQLAESMPAMAPPPSSSATRSVQLQLNGELLPDTTLTAYESDGRLHFEIRISDTASRSWLVGNLPWLVRQVGEKLERPLRVMLLASTSGEWHGVTIDWPEGTTS